MAGEATPARQRPTVILLMGVSGCGKSTTGANLAQATGWPFRDADTFHPPENIAKMKRGEPLTDADRQPWLAAIAAYIDERRVAGAPAIVSCSALKRAYREQLIGARRDVALVFLKGAEQLIADRLNRRRGHFMPPALLASQFAALEEPAEAEGALVVDIGRTPKTVVQRIMSALKVERA